MEDAAQCLPDPCSDGLTRSAMDAPLLLLVAEAAVLLVTSSAAYFWALWLERGLRPAGLSYRECSRPVSAFWHSTSTQAKPLEDLGLAPCAERN
jgi:hypothetical protein